MESLTCYIDPYSEKQAIKDNRTNENIWVPTDELAIYLHGLCVQKGYKKVWLEGPYYETFDLITKFQNLYKDEGILLLAN